MQELLSYVLEYLGCHTRLAYGRHLGRLSASLYSLTSTRSIRLPLWLVCSRWSLCSENEYATLPVAVAAALAEPSAAIGARRWLRIEPRSNWERTIRMPGLRTLTFCGEHGERLHHAPSLAITPSRWTSLFLYDLSRRCRRLQHGHAVAGHLRTRIPGPATLPAPRAPRQLRSAGPQPGLSPLILPPNSTWTTLGGPPAISHHLRLSLLF